MNYIWKPLWWLVCLVLWVIRLCHWHQWRYSGTGEDMARWCPCSALQVPIWEQSSEHPIKLYVLKGWRDIS